MGKTIVKVLRLGSLVTNCYLVANKETNEAIIFDPADDANQVADFLVNFGWKPVAILLTHGHIDHIGAVEELRRKYGIKVYAHKEEEEVLLSPRINLSVMMGSVVSVKPDFLLEDGQVLDIAGFAIKVLHTPGHTKGSCCYLFNDEGVLISGDTLFYSSYGRTDFPTGDESALIRSIKEKLLVLDKDIMVYPGHEGSTTIGNERKWYDITEI